MGEGHFGDDGQHDFLSLGGVGVLAVLIQPCFQGAGGFSSCVLSSCCAIKVYCPVSGEGCTEIHNHTQKQWPLVQLLKGVINCSRRRYTVSLLLLFKIYKASLHADISMELLSDL